MYIAQPLRANHPLNRHAPAVRAQLVAALAAAHAIGRSASIELRAAFAQAEQRRVGELEAHGTGLAIDRSAVESSRDAWLGPAESTVMVSGPSATLHAETAAGQRAGPRCVV